MNEQDALKVVSDNYGLLHKIFLQEATATTKLIEHCPECLLSLSLANEYKKLLMDIIAVMEQILALSLANNDVVHIETE